MAVMSASEVAEVFCERRLDVGGLQRSAAFLDIGGLQHTITHPLLNVGGLPLVASR
jgi:hypothetical protein